MTENAYQQARFNMVEQQVRPWEVMDARVLQVMGDLPRELFVGDDYKGLAYADIEVPLANGRHMLKPTVVGRMLQALNINPTDSILQIGSGSGYLTACMARLGKHVTSTEIQPELAGKAKENLASLGLNNITVEVGDALASIPGGAPFDVIAVTGAIADCEDSLSRELKDGGRLFFFSGEPPVMAAELITRINGDIFRQESLFETEVESLANLPRKAAFSF